MALKKFRADLHVHSCLSPCADWDMTPINIIDNAVKRNIDILAVCDHNSSENSAAVKRLGEKKGVHILPGLEVCTQEEVHMLTIFDYPEQAEKMQRFVYSKLTGENDPEIFGYQVVANEFDEVESQCPKLLSGAVTAGIVEIADFAHTLDGFVIAAHIDRPAFGIISQLGFVSEEMPFDCLEVSFRTNPDNMDKRLTGNDRFEFITSSDAHFPHEIGIVNTKFLIESPGVNELKKAVGKIGGRKKL